MSRKRLEPFELEIERLERGGVGVGTGPGGERVVVRAAPPGARVAVTPFGRSKRQYDARRTAMIRRPEAWVAPECAVFGLCGGCALQELGLSAQRAAKQAMALAEVGPGDFAVHPVRGAPAAYAYRNKVELSFGTRRYLSEEAHAAGEPIEGRFLGFHAPGRFDRVVDAQRCHLVSEAANALIGVVRTHTLAEGAPPPWDARAQSGYWRHLLVREGAGERLVALYTGAGEAPEALAEALLASDPGLVGVVWIENTGVADVARGAVRRVWGRDFVHERLGRATFRLGVTSFFQTSTAGAAVLYDTVGEALGETGGTLHDLYCGIGTIGQYLAGRFDRIEGVEEVEAAVADARENAARNGVSATYRAARVEDALPEIAGGAVVVDPPRAGLHPKVAAALAAARADVLVYVACNPASLGRDRAALEAGGWRMSDLWTVDLFPQTGHVEVVGRFARG